MSSKRRVVNDEWRKGGEGEERVHKNTCCTHLFADEGHLALVIGGAEG